MLVFLIFYSAMNYLRTNYLRRSTQYRKSTAEVIHFERRFYFILIYEISPPYGMCQKLAEIIRIPKKFVSPMSVPLMGAAVQLNVLGVSQQVPIKMSFEIMMIF